MKLFLKVIFIILFCNIANAQNSRSTSYLFEEQKESSTSINPDGRPCLTFGFSGYDNIFKFSTFNGIEETSSEKISNFEIWPTVSFIYPTSRSMTFCSAISIRSWSYELDWNNSDERWKFDYYKIEFAFGVKIYFGSDVNK